MINEHDDDALEHGHEHEEIGEMLEGLEFDAESQIFLEMRGQNLELLRVAAQVAGYSGSHGPLKPNDVRNALKSIWDVYSELYSWIDPEENEGEEEDEDEDEDE